MPFGPSEDDVSFHLRGSFQSCLASNGAKYSLNQPCLGKVGKTNYPS